MYDNAHTTGSISSSKEDKRRLAAASLDFNVKNITFCKLFPEYVEEKERRNEAALQEQVTVPLF
jgi:ubiquitin-conjugating enzyme E2 J2